MARILIQAKEVVLCTVHVLLDFVGSAHFHTDSTLEILTRVAKSLYYSLLPCFYLLSYRVEGPYSNTFDCILLSKGESSRNFDTVVSKERELLFQL